VSKRVRRQRSHFRRDREIPGQNGWVVGEAVVVVGRWWLVGWLVGWWADDKTGLTGHDSVRTEAISHAVDRDFPYICTRKDRP